MDWLGWGQKFGAVAQFGYVVEDLDQAIGYLIRDCSVGPFFVIEQRDYGLHYHGLAFEDCEAYPSPVPTGGDVIFIESDEPSAAPFPELLPASPAMDAHFIGFWKAAQNRDGSDPIRSFA